MDERLSNAEMYHGIESHRIDSVISDLRRKMRAHARLHRRDIIAEIAESQRELGRGLTLLEMHSLAEPTAEDLEAGFKLGEEAGIGDLVPKVEKPGPEQRDLDWEGWDKTEAEKGQAEQ